MTESRPAATARTSPVPRAPSKPVLLWAALGLLGVVLILTTLTRWLTSDSLRPAPHGSDQFLGWHVVAVQAIQYGLFASALVIVAVKLVVPLIKGRGLDFDGKLVIAGMLGGFVEPMATMYNTGLLYNTHLLNWGSWGPFIPGWRTPNAQTLASPPLFMFGMYVWFFAGFTFIGCRLARSLARRFPTVSNLTIFGVVYATTFAMDFGFEQLIIRTEVYAYPSIPAFLSLWGGTPYQYPVWSAFFGAAVLTGLTALRYFRREDGTSFVETGLQHVSGPQSLRQVISTLAVIGSAHSLVMAAWFVPFNLVSLHPDLSPTLPSYLRAGVCWPDTQYACPGRDLPSPDLHSRHAATSRKRPELTPAT